MIITIPGDPIALNRPRFYKRGFNIIAYDGQKDEKSYVSRLMALNFNQKPLELHCHVSIEFLISLPVSASLEDNRLRSWGLIQPSQKDIDNLIKFYLDCGNEILWKDDRLISKITAEKKFSKNPCTIISIDEITNNIMGKKSEKVFRIFDPVDFEDLARDLWDFPLCFDKSMQSKELLATRLVDFADKWVTKLSKIRTKN